MRALAMHSCVRQLLEAPESRENVETCFLIHRPNLQASFDLKPTLLPVGPTSSRQFEKPIQCAATGTMRSVPKPAFQHFHQSVTPTPHPRLLQTHMCTCACKHACARTHGDQGGECLFYSPLFLCQMADCGSPAASPRPASCQGCFWRQVTTRSRCWWAIRSTSGSPSSQRAAVTRRCWRRRTRWTRMYSAAWRQCAATPCKGVPTGSLACRVNAWEAPASGEGAGGIGGRPVRVLAALLADGC